MEFHIQGFIPTIRFNLDNAIIIKEFNEPYIKFVPIFSKDSEDEEFINMLLDRIAGKCKWCYADINASEFQLHFAEDDLYLIILAKPPICLEQCNIIYEDRIITPEIINATVNFYNGINNSDNIEVHKIHISNELYEEIIQLLFD